MHKKLSFIIRKDNKFHVLDTEKGTMKAIRPEDLNEILATSYGNILTGTKTGTINVLTYSPWISPEILHKAMKSLRFTDRLLKSLDNGEGLSKNSKLYVIFKLDTMTAFYITDGRGFTPYLPDHLAYCLSSEVHVIRREGLFDKDEPGELPRGGNVCYHNQDDRLTLFTFCIPYIRNSPIWEVDSDSFERIVNNSLSGPIVTAIHKKMPKAGIIEICQLVVGHLVAKETPYQPFYFSLMTFISAWALTSSNGVTSVKDVSFMVSVLSSQSWEDGDIVIKDVLESQPYFEVIDSTTIRRSQKSGV